MRHAIKGEYRRYEQRELSGLLADGQRHVSGVERVLATLRVWQARRRIRRQMARDMMTYTDAMFEDAGTTRKEAEREARKPFWRPLGS